MSDHASYLLDANALIALVIQEHEHHRRISDWSASADCVALCPITEGALSRYLLRVGESPQTVSAILQALNRSPQVEFWPDELSYSEVALDHITGHRQVTDAYLGSLAASHSAKLATFDRALASALPGHVLLVP